MRVVIRANYKVLLTKKILPIHMVNFIHVHSRGVKNRGTVRAAPEDMEDSASTNSLLMA